MQRLIDWKNVCLICLQKGENRSIFEQDDDSYVIADKIMKCADISIKKDPNQPKDICLQCLEVLNIAYEFRLSCQQSDSIIKTLLNTNHKEFEIKDLWKTTSITMNPIHDICFKDEIGGKSQVGATCDDECAIDLEDDPQSEKQFVVGNDAVLYVHRSAMELNNVKVGKSNNTKQKTNSEVSRRPRGRPKKSTKVSCERPILASTCKDPVKICEICNHSFRGQYGLDRHLKHHSNERPFTCGHCDKAFVTVEDLHRHMRVHTGEKPYECQYCNRRFPDHGHRKNYERTHTGERPFLCSTYGKSFVYSASLREHLRIHTGVKKFECKACEKGFSKLVLLKRHAIIHLTRDELDKSSEQKEKEIFKIEECPNSNEINIKHEIVDNDVVDNACDDENLNLEDDHNTDVKFVLENRAEDCNPKELNNVKTTESDKTKQEASTEKRPRGRPKKSTKVSCGTPGSKSYYKGPVKICVICNHSFRDQYGLDRHMKRHNNERPFACDHCDKAFVTSTELRRHMVVHTGQKPFKCQYCDRRFLDSHNRKNHERIHTNESPYVCQTCGKSFRYSYARTRHFRIHTRVKKFACKECGKAFDKKGHLKRHIALHLTQEEFNKSLERKQKRMLKKQIFKIEECANSNEINVKHEVVHNAAIDDTCDNSPCLDLKD